MSTLSLVRLKLNQSPEIRRWNIDEKNMNWKKHYHQILQTRKRSRVSLLKHMPKNAVCAEIGVWMGEFSDLILKYAQPAKLYLIDCWEFQPAFASEASLGTAKDQRSYDKMYTAVSHRLGQKPNTEIIRAYSQDAVTQFPDNFLDWLYLDANHSYQHVLRDIRLYLPKIKPGGYITGDDYTWGKEFDYPVKRAVHDILTTAPLKLVKTIRSQYILRKVGHSASHKHR